MINFKGAGVTATNTGGSNVEVTIPGAGDSSFIYANVAFVHPDGNDTTAVLGNFNRPFATIAGAFYNSNGLNNDDINNAIDNGLIEIWPKTGAPNKGYNIALTPAYEYTYQETRSLVFTKNCNIHLKSGVRIQYKPSNNDIVGSDLPYLAVGGQSAWDSTLGDQGEQSNVRVVVYGDDKDACSIEQLENTYSEEQSGTQVYGNTYLAYIRSYLSGSVNPGSNELKFSNISLYSEISHYFKPEDASSIRIGYNTGREEGKLTFENVYFHTKNTNSIPIDSTKQNTIQVSPQLGIVEVRNSQFYIEHRENDFSPNEGQISTHFYVNFENNLSGKYCGIRLHNSQFINYNRDYDKGIYVIWLKNSLGTWSEQYPIQISDCIFMAADVINSDHGVYSPGIANQPHPITGGRFCYFEGQSVSVFYISRSMNNYSTPNTDPGSLYEKVSAYSSEYGGVGFGPSTIDGEIAGYYLNPSIRILQPFNIKPVA